MLARALKTSLYCFSISTFKSVSHDVNMKFMRNRNNVHFVNILIGRLVGRLGLSRQALVRLSACILILGLVVWSSSIAYCEDSQEEVYGPQNLLKTTPNPFSTKNTLANQQEEAVVELGLIELSSTTKPQRRSLTERLNAPKLFLPERLVLGKCSEFIIKGPPGFYAAIAQAEKNTGAKPIYGHKLRLGSDRKVVAMGKIPESGVLPLFVEAPIQGDLVGGTLFFEAAVWSSPDFGDLTIATCMSPLRNGSDENSVLIAADVEKKNQGLFTFDPTKMKGITNYNVNQIGN
jgi:hypothetical protein